MMQEEIKPDLARYEANRQAWNAATQAHNSHKADQAAFFHGGGSTLFPEELGLLGDICDRTIVHLQCNAGQDSLSLAARGARVTGVDISDYAIEFARQLAADTAIAATFERSDIYAWFAEAQAAGRQFDIAFCSYGFLCWLSDLRGWARGIASVLKPCGRFVAVEFHPFSMIFDDDWSRTDDYPTGGQPLDWRSGVGDYVAISGDGLTPSGWIEGITDFRNPHPGHEWSWGLGEVVTALIEADLTLETLREYPYSNGERRFVGMREGEGKRMYPPAGMPAVPLMFGLTARRNAAPVAHESPGTGGAP
ncbi:MAG TPA: class I SAM-dependent methyltransferase [Thermomicrobiales bacterium]